MTYTDFQAAFIEALLWSSTDESDDSGGRPMDEKHTAYDIDSDVLAGLMSECERFESAHGDTIDSAERPRASGDYSARAQAGHDFALTRNGHGAGFWDGDWPEPLATVLTDASKAYGQVTLYIGDDGKIYSYEHVTRGHNNASNHN